MTISSENNKGQCDLKESLLHRNPKKTVGPENIWKDDKLNRENFAKTLTNFIKGLSHPLVISIDGCWGSGKTFMLERWECYLKKEGFSTIYFNAWEDDFHKDPLVAILGQLEDHFKGKKWEEAKKYAMPLIKAGTNIFVKSVSSGAVDLNNINPKNNVFTEYKNTKENFKNLKKTLKDLIKKEEEAKEEKLPLVFIIDELDRCRPTFAIEVLERIKHIFDIPNVVFVLGIDREQLGHSTKCVYGQKMDADGYLKRFIDINFILSQASPSVFCGHLLSEFGTKDFMLKRGDEHKIHKDDFNSFEKFFPELCKYFNFSLRDIEEAVSIFTLTAKNVKDGYYLHSKLLAMLIILKIKKKNLYRNYIQSKCFPAKVLNYLHKKVDIKNFDPNELGYNKVEFGVEFQFLEFDIYATGLEKDETSSERFKEILQDKEKLALLHKSYSQEKIEKFSKNIENFYFKKINKMNIINKETFKHLSDKIELSSSFLDKDI
ncbi:MAG: hypothetical protein GY750_03810 [Lentisphaerae bacterium]|nr:hypothetical protein [Lentisphaerota bacterium]MCP4100539.1 hypothetical protein [Lentisphaerota bacterium]